MRRQYLSKKTIYLALERGVPIFGDVSQGELQRWLREEENINVYCIWYDDGITIPRWNTYINKQYICGSICYEKALEKGLRKALKMIK